MHIQNVFTQVTSGQSTYNNVLVYLKEKKVFALKEINSLRIDFVHYIEYGELFFVLVSRYDQHDFVSSENTLYSVQEWAYCRNFTQSALQHYFLILLLTLLAQH